MYVCQCSTWSAISAGTSIATSRRSQRSAAFMINEKTPRVIHRKGSETSMRIGFTSEFITERSPARMTYAIGAPSMEKDPFTMFSASSLKWRLSCQKTSEYPMSEKRSR